MEDHSQDRHQARPKHRQYKGDPPPRRGSAKQEFELQYARAETIRGLQEAHHGRPVNAEDWRGICRLVIEQRKRELAYWEAKQAQATTMARRDVGGSRAIQPRVRVRPAQRERRDGRTRPARRSAGERSSSRDGPDLDDPEPEPPSRPGRSRRAARLARRKRSEPRHVRELIADTLAKSTQPEQRALAHELRRQIEAEDAQTVLFNDEPGDGS